MPFQTPPRWRDVVSGIVFWGAILTLVGAFGLLPFGASFDPSTGTVTLNVYDLATAVGAVAVPAGGVLAFFDRLAARSRIVGLF